MRTTTDSKTALMVAHPGHELRVWHWLEIECPRVVVVTDGSGRSGASRKGTVLSVTTFWSFRREFSRRNVLNSI